VAKLLLDGKTDISLVKKLVEMFLERDNVISYLIHNLMNHLLGGT
jgi:hypothetical protein